MPYLTMGRRGLHPDGVFSQQDRSIRLDLVRVLSDAQLDLPSQLFALPLLNGPGWIRHPGWNRTTIGIIDNGLACFCGEIDQH